MSKATALHENVSESYGSRRPIDGHSIAEISAKKNDCGVYLFVCISEILFLEVMLRVISGAQNSSSRSMIGNEDSSQPTAINRLRNSDFAVKKTQCFL